MQWLVAMESEDCCMLCRVCSVFTALLVGYCIMNVLSGKHANPCVAAEGYTVVYQAKLGYWLAYCNHAGLFTACAAGDIWAVTSVATSKALFS